MKSDFALAHGQIVAAHTPPESLSTSSANAPSKVASPSSAFSVTGGSAVPEWMNTPEKRRDIWALQALAAAYVGDKEKADEYMARAVAEDRLCAAPRLPELTDANRTEK